MIIEPFRTDDIVPFVKLATAEGWVAEPWEFEFLLSEFPQGCFTAREYNGEPAGYVTSLRHERSGWIGNLIVSKEKRGQGGGKRLFASALHALKSADVETFWLTASKSGQSLYEKYGFIGIDSINRWVGTGRGQGGAHDVPSEKDTVVGLAYDLDSQSWGDRRSQLLDVTARRGVIRGDASGFLVQQPCGNAVQLGPFSALNTSAAERLFEDAVNAIASVTKVLLDAPASNGTADRLYSRNNMRIAGSNVLMYAGTKPEYRPELIHGLATMGSCG